MGYQVQEMEWEEAIRQVDDYEYALLYMISERILSRTEDLPQIHWEECLEARFFSEEKELHLFEGENGKKAIKICDQEPTDIVVKKYQLSDSLSKIGKVVFVQEYLEYDEDGQVSIALTRLKSIA